MAIKKKICSKCGVEKLIDEFHIQSEKKDGHHSHCRACRQEFNILNKERTSAYDHDYYLSNKKNILAKTKKYYLDNKERISSQKCCYNKGFAKYGTYSPQLSIDDAASRGANGELLVSCTYCGKVFLPTVGAVRTRAEALKGQTEGECRLYCSEACKQACPSYKRSKHWKFQKIATSREVSAQFRHLVLKRDNWTCQRCGSGVEAELHVHHIEGATQQPGIANDLENGITLCKACHKFVHSQKGCKYRELRCHKSDILNVISCVSLGLKKNTDMCLQPNTLGI